MRLLVTPTFERAVKKLNYQQKSLLYGAVLDIAATPAMGEFKLGDLKGIQVY